MEETLTLLYDDYIPVLRDMLAPNGGVLGWVSLPVLALLALLRGRSGRGPLNVLLRFLPSDSAASRYSKPCQARSDFRKHQGRHVLQAKGLARMACNTYVGQGSASQEQLKQRKTTPMQQPSIWL